MKYKLLISVTLLIIASVGMAHANLIAYYTFDDDTSTDLSGNGNDGAVGSALTFSSDQPGVHGTGKAIVGDGTEGATGIVTVPTSASLETLVHELTISLWIKADAASNANWVRFAIKGTQASGQGSWMLNRNSSSDETNIRVDTFGTGGLFNQNRGITDDSNVLDNAWHHLVYVLDNGQFEEWVDGALVGSGAYNHGANGFGNTEPLLLVGRGNPNLVGAMDEVSVWSRRLTSGDIALLNAGVSPLTVPEASSVAMMGFGGILLLLRRRF